MIAGCSTTDLKSYLTWSGRGWSAAGVAEFPDDAVLDPVGIPPFDRIHHAAVHEHREVQVIAAGQAGHPAPADRLSAAHVIAHLDVERRQMAIQRLDAHP